MHSKDAAYSYSCSMVCVSVGHNHELCYNGSIDDGQGTMYYVGAKILPWEWTLGKHTCACADILNVPHKRAAAMQYLATSTVATC